jgi:methylthioribose-1-phosphate isomerase
LTEVASEVDPVPDAASPDSPLPDGSAPNDRAPDGRSNGGSPNGDRTNGDRTSGGVDLARRHFFRAFADQIMQTAATVAGVAGELQRTSQEAASVLLQGDAREVTAGGGRTGGPAAPTAVADTSNPLAGAPTGFRTAFRWDDGRLILIDQRRLPNALIEVTCESPGDVVRALHDMVVRGAPAMGQVAAIGLAIAAGELRDAAPTVRKATLIGTVTALRNARPTAINVRWALDRCMAAVDAAGGSGQDGERIAELIRLEAEAIITEAAQDHERLATLALAELPVPADRRLELLTHCNTGPLACGQFGTALGVVQAAVHAGRSVHVFVDETRPYLQGARLTAWELGQAGVPHTIIADAAAGWVLATRGVDAVLVGADRIAANGDTANKIGTYPLAVLAQRHGIPFYVCAPTSSVDLATPDGSLIPIEQRVGSELTTIRGVPIAPPESPVLNPGFDVTPADLIGAIVTEEGVLRPPFGPALAGAVEGARARRRPAGGDG